MKQGGGAWLASISQGVALLLLQKTILYQAKKK
jgi:hypothetical protein